LDVHRTSCRVVCVTSHGGSDPLFHKSTDGLKN
jgi:hypothetical protein